MYKLELQQTRNGSLKMEDYLNKMKNIADNLQLAGCPISNDDLIPQILVGFDLEHNPIIVQLSYDKNNISSMGLQSILLTYEIIFEQLNNLIMALQT